MKRLLLLLPILALTACEASKGLIRDVENATDAVADEISEM